MQDWSTAHWTIWIFQIYFDVVLASRCSWLFAADSCESDNRASYLYRPNYVSVPPLPAECFVLFAHCSTHDSPTFPIYDIGLSRPFCNTLIPMHFYRLIQGGLKLQRFNLHVKRRRRKILYKVRRQSHVSVIELWINTRNVQVATLFPLQYCYTSIVKYTSPYAPTIS